MAKRKHEDVISQAAARADLVDVWQVTAWWPLRENMADETNLVEQAARGVSGCKFVGADAGPFSRAGGKKPRAFRSVFFDCQTKKAASTLRAKLLKTGVNGLSVKGTVLKFSPTKVGELVEKKIWGAPKKAPKKAAKTTRPKTTRPRSEGSVHVSEGDMSIDMDLETAKELGFNTRTLKFKKGMTLKKAAKLLLARNPEEPFPYSGLYLSPYYGWRSLANIKNRTFVDIRKPSVIDPEIFDVVAQLNELPFVVQTVESCSGHLKGDRFTFPDTDTDQDDEAENFHSTGPFLYIIYVISPEAERFDAKLRALFAGEYDSVENMRDADDADVNWEERCHACGNTGRCGCYAAAAKVQVETGYWKFRTQTIDYDDPMKAQKKARDPALAAVDVWATEKKLREFWNRVEELVRESL